jgi:hypothetical protein
MGALSQHKKMPQGHGFLRNVSKYLPGATGGRRRKTRRRRRHRGKDFDEALKRVIAQHRRFRIAMGDKRFKKTKGLVKCTRKGKGKRTAKIYHRRKCRKNERRVATGGRRTRRRR